MTDTISYTTRVYLFDKLFDHSVPLTVFVHISWKINVAQYYLPLMAIVILATSTLPKLLSGAI